jgi:hypothetical protein
MPLFHIVGPIGPEAIDYGPVPAASPIEALHRVHRDALGPRSVRLVAGRFVFADPADRALCSGRWRVSPADTNGKGTEFQIAAFDAADGATAA